MDFEIRADGVLHIEGYVNAVERDSRIVMCPECGKCVEQIAAGAFGNALRAAKNVDMLLNHDKGRKIGSTSEGTLTLTEDSIGLRASADITDEEVVEKARNGLLRGWSFGFKATDTEIERRSQGVPRRHVKALNISEVSLVDDRYRPCYAGTSIELRADEEGAEEADFTELRFNPYHDPNTGRFTDSSGGGTGGVLFSKGGKSAYVVADSEFTDKPAKNDNAAKSQDFIKNNEQLIKETQRLSVHYAESLKNNDLKKDEYDELIAELPRNITANQRFTVSDSNGSYLISGTTFEIGNEKYGYFTTNRTNEFVADLSGSGKAIHVSEHDSRGNKLYSIPGKLSSTARTLKNIREVVNRAEPDISDALPDYSSYEARLARARMRELELRAEELELRFNPYHDPQNGRFTTANGGGSGGFLYSKGGKSAYVFERDIDGEYEQWKKKKSASKALPEHLSEQIGKYTVTDEEIILQSGKKIPHNGGSYIEKISPDGMKLAKESDIKSPVVFPSRYGNLIVPREVGEKAKSLYETAKANYSANLKNNVPGLDEINKISIAYSNEQYLSRKSIENGYGRLHTPKVTAKDIEAVKKKYPVATKYLTAESFWDSSNDIKSALGREAMDAIRLGDDPDEAIKRMKSEWEKYLEKSMEYD